MSTDTKTDKYAVILTGGKQYKVSEGDYITIEKLPGDNKEGDKVTFDNVLLIDDGEKLKAGTPMIEGAKVEGEFIETGRAKKILVIHYKSKSRYFKKQGHRQPFNKVKIVKI
ncbi:MAG: large subunit ribosomal protein L21 [Candidatus Paceibacteria bacterium]|jgi:large subunit ribosomal protein L21